MHSPHLALNIGFNLVAPVLILSRWSGGGELGAMGVLFLALAFPLGYGAYELFREQQWNLLSVAGILSVLLTATFALLRAGPILFAVNEALVPLVFGAITLLSGAREVSVVRSLFFNRRSVRTELVEQRLAAENREASFRELLRHAAWLLGIPVLAGGVLNLVVALLLLESTPGTAEFNEELGRVKLVSLGLVVVPVVIFGTWAARRFYRGLKHLTGLQVDEFLT